LRSNGSRFRHARPHSGDWERRLSSASSTEEVVSLSREFMSQWSAAQLAMLPRICRPRMLGDIDDLMLYACVLEEEEQKFGRFNAILGSITAFFTAASGRLPQLVAMSSSPRGRISAAW
jgi:hypothetical protein